MKFLKSKLLGLIIMFIVCIIFICIVILTVRTFTKSFYVQTPYMFLEGEYCIDNGEWNPIDMDKPINETFKNIKFRGNIPKRILTTKLQLTIATKNVWIKMRSSDGQIIIDNTPLSFDEFTKDYWQEGMDPNDPDLQEGFQKHKDLIHKLYPFSFDLPSTPGYYCMNMDAEDITDAFPDLSEVYYIEIENPYDFAPARFSDIFSVTISDGNGVHQRIIEKMMPMLVIFAAICLFGIFFFPVASIILGRIDFKYLSFGALCFFWGIYMVMQSIGGMMNNWIHDPTVCLFLDKTNANLFVIALIVYFRSNLTKPVSRAVSGVLAILDIIAVVISSLCQVFSISDMIVSGVYVNIIIAITSVAFIILLSSEIKSSREALVSMIMWTPMIMAILIDILNQFISFSSLHYFTYGFAVTMIGQIVRIVFDLRRQYLESIHYQQMQKELYEAKVQVMVSQIRPHFMYNALSSIAMLCKLKPETAYEATIKFSDYLRGNMDSLKQTAPVPFRKELEHLEKYLYIEKLRFGKKLNIEYDIQADDFEIPLLSVQPLVENAVKHGVGMKEDGGTVTISTRKNGGAYEVIIADDGVGFDTNEVKNDGRSHIGMENTRRRLKDMCNAEVVITSTVGEGTTAKIIIPADKEETE